MLRYRRVIATAEHAATYFCSILLQHIIITIAAVLFTCSSTMAEEDNRSAISSLIGSVVGGFTDNSKHLFGTGRFETLKATLAAAAGEGTVLNGGYEGSDVVKSPHIERMLAAYRVASGGRIIVVCSPADSGKTKAAEFLIHGKHPFRPARSLMVSATAMEDFPTEFSRDELGVEKAGPVLGQILCKALKSVEPPSSAGEFAVKAGKAMDKATCTLQETRPFVETNAINMYGPGQIPSPAVDRKRLPMLIIDNFNEATDENRAFVKKLLQEASQFGVFVFILTSNETWATTLVGLNSGSKIKPLHGNVDNANYEITDPFQGVPEWNTLPWPVETLRELIRPVCDKHGVDPAAVVLDGDEMLPVEAKDRVLRVTGF